MKKLTFAILLIYIKSFSVYGQTKVQTKEVKISYTNGYEIFSICTLGCQTTFDDKLDYFWYTDFSKIKSLKGGSGGSLLHGDYKFYDELGNLRQNINYYLGLRDGNGKYWDSLGNITSITKYDKGEIVYWKFKDKDDYWIEHIGRLFTDGWIKKTYTSHNSLILEQTMLPNFIIHTRTFYEFETNKVKEDYFSDGFGDDCLRDKYLVYFANGKIKTEGQFYDGECTNVRVGVWKWYKADGTLELIEEYKAYIEKWSNGDYKVVGCLVFDKSSNMWLKNGIWFWFTEDGKIEKRKKFKLGVEVLE